MLRHTLLATSLLAVGPVATAQTTPCPPSASTASTISPATKVRVVGLHADDPHYEGHRAEVVGVSATTAAALTNNGDCWFGGPVIDASGATRFFYKAAFVLTDSTGSASTGSASTGSASNAPSCPSRALRSAPTTGQTYTVAAIHPEDAYRDNASTTLGARITFGEDAEVSEDCWINGPATGSDGTEFYFYKVAVRPTQAGSDDGPFSCPSDAHRAPIPQGTTLTFLGVHPEDAYNNGELSLEVGDTVRTTGEMGLNGDCWYGGPVSSGDSEFYFFKAAFQLGSDASSGQD